MRRTFPLALCLVALASEAIALPAPPAVGTTIRSDSKELGGWSVEGRQFWCTDLDSGCTAALLYAEDTAAVALTTPTRRSANGGVEEEVIVRVFTVRTPRDVIFADCDAVEGRLALLGWNDERRRISTIFTTNGDTLFRTELAYDDGAPPHCDTGDG